MQAVVKVGNSQYLVSPGQKFSVDGHVATPDSELVLDQVLLTIDGDSVAVGQPVLKSKITTRVVRHYQGPKVLAETFKAKSRFRKTKGFRAHFTELEVTSIA